MIVRLCRTLLDVMQSAQDTVRNGFPETEHCEIARRALPKRERTPLIKITDIRRHHSQTSLVEDQ
jgi:hypothetical protein